MFQNYVHAAAIDTSLPTKVLEPGGVIFTYSPRSFNGATFSAALADGESLRVTGLQLAPPNTLLSVNVGIQGKPPGLSAATIFFVNESDIAIGTYPLHGNGLGQVADAITIPPDAVAASIFFFGIPEVRGQVRAVSREVIPYQPLKG